MRTGARISALVLLAPTLLGCGSLEIFPNSKDYVPLTARINDPVQYQKDLAECHLVADGYRPGINTGNVAQSTFNGAANNAGYGVVNTLVPVAGAVGGAAVALVAGIGITGQDSITILVRCIVEETRRDNSAVVADPH